GIRDRNVTGVQTCALPIYLPVQTLRPMKTDSVSVWTVDQSQWTIKLCHFLAFLLTCSQWLLGSPQLLKELPSLQRMSLSRASALLTRCFVSVQTLKSMATMLFFVDKRSFPPRTFGHPISVRVQDWSSPHFALMK